MGYIEYGVPQDDAAFSPDGLYIASASEDRTGGPHCANLGCLDGQVTGQSIRRYKPRALLCMAFSRDGHLIASGSSDGTVRLHDVGTGQIVGDPLRAHSSGVGFVAFSPDAS